MPNEEVIIIIIIINIVFNLILFNFTTSISFLFPQSLFSPLFFCLKSHLFQRKKKEKKSIVIINPTTTTTKRLKQKKNLNISPVAISWLIIVLIINFFLTISPQNFMFWNLKKKAVFSESTFMLHCKFHQKLKKKNEKKRNQGRKEQVCHLFHSLTCLPTHPSTPALLPTPLYMHATKDREQLLARIWMKSPSYTQCLTIKKKKKCPGKTCDVIIFIGVVAFEGGCFILPPLAPIVIPWP